MRVLILGGAGFLGRHLARHLHNRGDTVSVIDRAAPVPFTNSVRGDVNNALETWLLRYGAPDVIVHLAALVGRIRSSAAPDLACADNAGVSWYVGQLAAEYKVPVVYASSSEVYGDHGDGFIDELTECKPKNIYGWSKLWGEQALAAQLVGPDRPGLVVARLSMPYGPGHPPGPGRAAMTNFLEHARRGLPLYVHEGGARSWCYVSDTVAALGLLVRHATIPPVYRGQWLNRPAVYNVGRHDDLRPMVEVARLACQLCNRNPDELVEVVPMPPDVTEVKGLSCQKLRFVFGWEPQVPLEEGMRNTLRWLEGRTVAGDAVGLAPAAGAAPPSRDG